MFQHSGRNVISDLRPDIKQGVLNRTKNRDVLGMRCYICHIIKIIKVTDFNAQPICIYIVNPIVINEIVLFQLSYIIFNNIIANSNNVLLGHLKIKRST